MVGRLESLLEGRRNAIKICTLAAMVAVLGFGARRVRAGLRPLLHLRFRSRPCRQRSLDYGILALLTPALVLFLAVMFLLYRRAVAATA